MSTKPTGGPAFPVDLDVPNQAMGLSVRDAFAIAALPAVMDRDSKMYVRSSTPSDFAEAVYRVADAMMLERAK